VKNPVSKFAFQVHNLQRYSAVVCEVDLKLDGWLNDEQQQQRRSVDGYSGGNGVNDSSDDWSDDGDKQRWGSAR
jgi:hypothetical protein